MCNTDCKWMYDEPQAGLIHYCGNEELTEEEYDCIQNGKQECPYYESMND